MKKKTLTLINLSLVALLILSSISSVILEATGGNGLSAIRNTTLVVLHIVLTLTLFTLAYYHVKFHFGPASRWSSFFKKTKKQNRWLLWLVITVLVTGLLATLTYSFHGHTLLGALHGKIGFVALLAMLIHLHHRRKWFRTIFHSQDK